MTLINRNKKSIIGPLIGLLALLCGSAFASTPTEALFLEINKQAKTSIKFTMKKHIQELNKSMTNTKIKPLSIEFSQEIK